MRETTPLEWAVRPLRHYADFNGRAPRAEYWWFYVFSLVLGFAVGMLDRAFGAANAFRTMYDLALFVPSMAVMVRRLHDTDRSGWWVVAFVAAACIIVLVGFALLGVGHSSRTNVFTLAVSLIVLILGVVATFLVFMVLPGTQGPNRYGPDPYRETDLEEVFS